MSGNTNPPERHRSAVKGNGIVGAFIRQRRESLGLSQRALGQLFQPPVTTQFISNLERGVTPLPPVHIATLTRALRVVEADFKSLLEKEYTRKLSGRLGSQEPDSALSASINVCPEDYNFFRALYDAYNAAEPSTKQGFMRACENLLKMSRG